VKPKLAVDGRSPEQHVLGVVDRLDQVHQHPRPLEVGEKLVTEADALARTLQQPGHVSHRELASIVRVDGAQHRLDGRERVVGHLRLGVRDPPQQRRLARVREAQQGGVGDQLEPQLDPHLVAQLAHLGSGRCAPGRGRIAPVAAAATAPRRHHRARLGVGEVGQHRALVA
jgi:hypothetical protein